MTISGFNPSSTLPGLEPSGMPLAGTNPLLAGSTGGQFAAMAGVAEQPGIGARLVSAMKAAIGELRGSGATDAQIRTQLLAMQAQAPVTLAKVATSAKPVMAMPIKKSAAPAVVHTGVKSWKTLAPRTPVAASGVTPKVAVAAPAAALPAASAPSNATQLPGATVYSYDQSGNPIGAANPAAAGLQGLAPTMQQQLGMNPTMLQGITGMAQGIDPDGAQGRQGPQVNATNQTSLNGAGTAGPGYPLAGTAGPGYPLAGTAGPGYPLAGSVVPVLGAPIIVAPTNVPAPAAPTEAPSAPTPASVGSAAGTAGTNQQVTNRNATDVGSLNQGTGYGYGSGYGASPWDPTGGVATPYSPYGSSMTGASVLGDRRQGFFSRLFG